MRISNELGKHTLRPVAATAMVLAVAALACATLTSGVSPLATATATASPPARETAPATERAPAEVPGGTSLQIEGGPVIGSPRETRVALSEQVSELSGLAPEQYDPADYAQVGRTFTYTVTLDQNRELIWAFGWCATTPEILDQNLEQMAIEFQANDTLVHGRQLHVWDGQNGELECRFFTAVVYEWPTGTSTLKTHVTFKEKTNDGLSDYPEGAQTFVYVVTAP